MSVSRHRRMLALGVFAVGFSFLLVGCGPGEIPDPPAIPEPELTVAPNPNAPTDCTIGTLACACSAGGGCGLDQSGEQLNCVAGVCLLPACPPGDLGCECRNDATCVDGECAEGFCVATGCQPGSLNCECAFGGCDVGLICQGGAVCVDQTGFEGGACLANGSCHPGNRCDVSLDTCVFCDRGTQGCACTDVGSCGAGLSCQAGLCLSASQLPPENPKCYTPCLDDLEQGGSERTCDEDHLLAGCIGDTTCREGSCLAAGELAPTCQSEVDCPFFQTCLQGRCFSNCESSVDCPSGLGCHQRVCRTPCNLEVGAVGCPASQTCDSADGETGFCVSVRPPPPAPAPLPQGDAFQVTTEGTVTLTNLQDAAAIRLIGRDAASQVVTVRKLSHRLRMADGTVEEIDTPIDDATGLPLPCSGASTRCPLWWLRFGPDIANGAPTDAYETFLPAGCDADCPVVAISNGMGSPGVAYEGRLLVTGPGGSQEVSIQYTEDVSGRWVGEMHYFTNFGDEGIEAWLARDNKSDVADVRNGLIQRWGAFRIGNLEGGFEELEAVLTSTQTGSWQNPSVQSLCDAVTGGSESAVCYPYLNPEGVRRYVQNTNIDPVPSATTALPIAFNLQTTDAEGRNLTGRIDSDFALQYPNNPALSLQLSGPASQPGACAPSISSDCVVFVDQLVAEVSVGGRYISDGPSCAPGYVARTVPWLVPGLGESAHTGGGGLVRTECRDASQPFDDPDLSERNGDLAGANPVPDGKPRTRTIELLDGALINQQTLLLLIRESFPSFLPGSEDVKAYGFAILRRNAANLDEDDVVGLPALDIEKSPPDFGTACQEEIDAPFALAPLLIDGSTSAPGGVGPALSDTEVTHRVHYLCNGAFDGGGGLEEAINDPFGGGTPPVGSGYVRDANGTLYIQTPGDCFPGDDVTFFYSDDSIDAFTTKNAPCNAATTCRSTFDAWVNDGRVTEVDPIWRCADTDRALCDDDLDDRRVGKLFFERPPSIAAEDVMLSLPNAIDAAFRYKTRFTSGLDESLEVGFSPLPCVAGSDQRPYCYDAAEIEALRDRYDCLVDMYTNARGQIPATDQARLDEALRASFSEYDNGLEGFERLYAELLVMLGDDELTSAFASRFDLAGVDTENFEGSLFETDGINLSSVAGAEMAKLHRAVQYYTLVLDRFYRMGPHFAKALTLGDTGSPTSLISPQTVTLYLPKVVKASSQRAIANSEIAKRYRDFNRPDLAERVLSRAYAETYLESVLVARLMLDISARSQGQFRDQIAAELERVQRTYRVALLDMKDIFDEVKQGATFFGFPREYVPFPAIDTSTTGFGTNGFEALLATARTKMLTAKEREQIAFDSLISSRLDVAQFQNELVRVRNSFEDQLATICGTFVADDGVRLPAIKKYAGRSTATQFFGDPCGFFAEGNIFEAMLEVDAATAGLETTLTRYRNARQSIIDEQNRVKAQCDFALGTASYEYAVGDEIRNLEKDIADTQFEIGIVTKALSVVKEGVDQASGCLQTTGSIKPFVCAGLAAGSVTLSAVSAGFEIGLEAEVNRIQNEIAQKRLDLARWNTEGQCDAANIDSARTMGDLIRGLDEIRLEALRSNIQLQLEVAQLAKIRNEAARLQDRQAEAEQHLINVEAARNDPNVRIFRNESIINADFAFEDALRAAYRATRMYEYYTSTSYARLDELFLVRLAGKGSVNLENYLIELENAFADFEEDLGLPDARVAIYSLRDDILQIPLLGESGQPLSQAERIARMQAALNDPNRLDRNGYITIPFGTAFEQLSPLTRNHKIRYIEANVIGSNVGDRVGRIYLRQKGTSILQSVDDSLQYFVFPPRTAVVDVFYNGNRVFEPQVYQNLRLRDRPVAHTMWELVVNQRDEEVNRDIDLSSVSDIQIFIHYTDFTTF